MAIVIVPLGMVNPPGLKVWLVPPNVMAPVPVTFPLDVTLPLAVVVPPLILPEASVRVPLISAAPALGAKVPPERFIAPLTVRVPAPEDPVKLLVPWRLNEFTVMLKVELPPVKVAVFWRLKAPLTLMVIPDVPLVNAALLERVTLPVTVMVLPEALLSANDPPEIVTVPPVKLVPELAVYVPPVWLNVP